MSVNAKRALEKVAEQHGVSLEEVQREIEQLCVGNEEMAGLNAEQIVEMLAEKAMERLGL